jgi:predicted enzyme related to lactoylglutathione lyase
METRFCVHIHAYDKTRAFYDQVLSWAVYSEWNRAADDRGVVYQAGSLLLEFLLSEPDKATRFDPSFYLYIEVDGLDALHDKLRANGCICSDIRDYPWGHSSFTVQDPAGLTLKFFKKAH